MDIRNSKQRSVPISEAIITYALVHQERIHSWSWPIFENIIRITVSNVAMARQSCNKRGLIYKGNL